MEEGVDIFLLPPFPCPFKQRSIPDSLPDATKHVYSLSSSLTFIWNVILYLLYSLFSFLHFYFSHVNVTHYSSRPLFEVGREHFNVYWSFIPAYGWYGIDFCFVCMCKTLAKYFLFYFLPKLSWLFAYPSGGLQAERKWERQKIHISRAIFKEHNLKCLLKYIYHIHIYIYTIFSPSIFFSMCTYMCLSVIVSLYIYIHIYTCIQCKC